MALALDIRDLSVHFRTSAGHLRAVDSVTLHGGDKRACNLSIVLRRSPERLLQGVLASNTLIVGLSVGTNPPPRRSVSA